MATKVNLQDATKKLVTDASGVLENAVRIRKSADTLLDALKKTQNGFIQAQEEELARHRKKEQEEAQAAHVKAYVHMDDDERRAVEEAMRATPEQAPANTAEAEKAPKAEAKAETKAEAKAPKEKKAAEPVKSEKPAANAEAAPVAEKKPAEEKPGAAETAEKPAKPAEDKREQKPAAEKNAKPQKPAIGQIMSRPGDEVPARPVGLAPNVIRGPRPANTQPRPQGQPVPAGRPGMNQAFNNNRTPNGQGPRPANPNAPFNNRPGMNQNPRPAQNGQAPRPFGQNNGTYPPRTGNAPQNGFRNGGQQGGFAAKPPMGGGRPGMNQGGGFNGGRPGGRPGAGPIRGPKAPELFPVEEKAPVSNYDPNKKQYIRQHDPEHVARNRKQASKNSNYSGYDDEVIRGGKRSRAKKPSAQQMMAPIKIETAYMAGDTITVRDLTEKIGKPAGEIIKKLFMLGNMATINSEIDFDTAQLVCSDFEITLEKKVEQTAEDALVAEDFNDEEENLIPRSPVVTIMGHVDHGKTSLLDCIRASRVTAGEAGGITQHIGAYQVRMDDGRSITFLDTPGHEAFTAMRARGTQATDIAVLVVAADDSVMPQTVESINHAKAAEVPIIVAINKMDKPEANPEKVKQDLTQYGLVCEDWGGETICVPVSAKTGAGVDDLMEMILLQADMLQLRANPNRNGRGVIIEAKLDKARGPLATVLMQNGTLHVGDSIIAGMASGRIRAMINDRGERVVEAGPAMPVEIMGFDEVPSAGDEMIAVSDEHLGRQVADERREKLKASREATMAKMSMENLFSSIEAGKVTTLNLIIKADVQGSVEAVKQAMEKLSNDEVKVRVLHSAAGAITKDDVNLANAFNAVIIGFNVRPDASAREEADKAKVDVRLYTVIYKAIEDMEKAMKGLLEPEYREVLLGHAEVRNVFKITGAGIIAGCYVTDGKVQRNAGVRLLRENVVVHEGKLSSLKHLKDDVKEMAAGYECGMSLEGHNDIKEGDIVECFIMEEIPR